MPRLPLLVSLVVSLSLLMVSCGRPVTSQLEEAWDSNNDPRNLAAGFERLLASLPLTGDVAQKPWSDTYWPSYQGGIAARWNDPSHPDPFTVAPPTFAALGQLTEADVAKLSPAEKYDVFVGNAQYKLFYQQRLLNAPTEPQWHGFCHGWSPAALNFKEPRPVTMTSPQGIRIPFGSSDVKALLLFAQQYQRKPAETHSLGARCDADLATNPGAALNPECRDTNAGAFHVALANMLGVRGVGFVADINRDEQVWNQPVHGFSSEIVGRSATVGPSAAPGTTEVVEVKTTLRYVQEFGPRWEASPFADFSAQHGERAFAYRLELNASGEIVGGEWTAEQRPDFLWTQTAPTFGADDYLSKVPEIYAAAVGE